MNFPLKLIQFLIIALITAGTTASHAADDFQTWLQNLEQEALALSYDASTVRNALAGLQPIERVIELDRRQPEFSLTFSKYLNGAVSEKRIAKGKGLLVKHKALLTRVSAR